MLSGERSRSLSSQQQQKTYFYFCSSFPHSFPNKFSFLCERNRRESEKFSFLYTHTFAHSPSTELLSHAVSKEQNNGKNCAAFSLSQLFIWISRKLEKGAEKSFLYINKRVCVAFFEWKKKFIFLNYAKWKLKSERKISVSELIIKKIENFTKVKEEIFN